MASEPLTAVTLTLCLAVGIMVQSLILVQSPEFYQIQQLQMLSILCRVENGKVAGIDLEWEIEHVSGITTVLLRHRRVDTFLTLSTNLHLRSFRDIPNNRFNFTILNVNSGDSGIYYCRDARTNSRGTGSEIIVASLSGPLLVQSPKLVNVREGGMALFECSMENARVEKISVEWYRVYPKQLREWILTHQTNDEIVHPKGFTQRLLPSRNISTNTYILILPAVSLSDAAIYHCCILDNNCGDGSQLNVTNAVPILVQSPTMERVTEGRPAQLRCSMKKASVSSTDVHWYRQQPGQEMEWILTHYISDRIKAFKGFTQRLQPSRDTSKNTYLLVFRVMTLSDAAVYHCCVWTDVCGDGTQLNITSEAIPLLVQSPTLESVLEGRSARFQCSMEKASVSSTDVHWYRQLPGQQREWILTHDTSDRITGSKGYTDRLQSSRLTSNNTYILMLRLVTFSDAAVYHCCVWGDICGDGTRLNVTTAVPLLVQSPTLERVTEGHPARLQCSMEKASVSSTDVHWYRQLPGQQREWILTHDRNGRKADHEYVNQRLQPSRVISNNTYILILRRVRLSDVAIYHCCVWVDVCGDGTQLNVTMSRERVWITMGTALGALACFGAAFLIYKMCDLK